MYEIIPNEIIKNFIIMKTYKVNNQCKKRGRLLFFHIFYIMFISKIFISKNVRMFIYIINNWRISKFVLIVFILYLVNF